MVERNLAKVEVAGSSPVSRSNEKSTRVDFLVLGYFMALYPSGLRGRSAKPLFVGSNPTGASNKAVTIVVLSKADIRLTTGNYY